MWLLDGWKHDDDDNNNDDNNNDDNAYDVGNYLDDLAQLATGNWKHRRKTTTLKYDPPYSKKPIAKGYASAAATAANHHSVEEVSLDGSSKLVYANQAGFRWATKTTNNLTIYIYIYLLFLF